ncbi:right-handed parallel beta-helix repeat-containing protein [Rhizobium halophytocola]|uniref:Right handed beta helix domain-containing protein n=1 Tax=Rhizobium halophytocola TaxID=735519 RepID=A0ABS4E0D6_9HYPH|nr:right-handed parallel beta-helix repeat-containing protein [Rhizobium halophytocola]MBP1851406.1 hypothetical protein [Rhizobium halophytocola]
MSMIATTWTNRMAMLAGMAVCIGAALTLAPSPAQAAACSASTLTALRSAPSAGSDSVRIDCDLTLSASDVIVRRLIFAGAQASGVTLDCKGATIGTRQTKTSYSDPTIAIRSLRDDKTGAWSVPRDITIRNCNIRGNIRLIGLGPNGQAKYVRLSSFNRDHTQNAQANAPSGITLRNLTITGTGGIPLYFAPGVTKSSITGSRFVGKSNQTAIYLDAESAGNTISNNRFSLKAGREMIAVDGSADNQIVANTFDDPVDGGVYVYRNCGEGGTIRHQPPQYNVISDNRFDYKKGLARPAIWLNMRDAAGKLLCTRDEQHPFGSSLDPSDQAKYNVVQGNRFKGLWTPAIINFDGTNDVRGNN